MKTDLQFFWDFFDKIIFLTTFISALGQVKCRKYLLLCHVQLLKLCAKSFRIWAVKETTGGPNSKD